MFTLECMYTSSVTGVFRSSAWVRREQKDT